MDTFSLKHANSVFFRQAPDIPGYTGSLEQFLSPSLSISALRVNSFHMTESSSSIAVEPYRDEGQLPLIQPLIDHVLSEPYSIFTYRYFLTQWPHLCYLAMVDSQCVGVIVCKQEPSKRGIDTGYIAMLAVRDDYRNKGLGSTLVSTAIQAMLQRGCEQVTLEAEVTNKAALTLYDNLGFIRDKRLEKYYLNGNDAFRLKLSLQPTTGGFY